jgi:hypothetical protein
MRRSRASSFLLGVAASLCLVVLAAVAFVDVAPDWSGAWESDEDREPEAR